MSKIFRLFILSLCLLSLQLNCFAGNILQQEYETAKMQELAQEPALHNMSKERLFENDYQGYLNGGRSLYGYLLVAQSEAHKTKNYTDLKYSELMLNQYNMRIKASNSNLFRLQKIIVDDQDYKKVSELIRICLYFHNMMAY